MWLAYLPFLFFLSFSLRAQEGTDRFGEGSAAGERKTLTAGGVEYAFRWCPAGTFTMGSPEKESDREDDEQRHPVKLTRGFWLLESEVTQGMWDNVMGSTSGRTTPNLGEGPEYPIYTVDWNEAVEFCAKLSELSGESITLPTEAQWEYACRAGSDKPSSGSGELNEMGWYWSNSVLTTHKVKQKDPNAWGLYDMHGNVWEWCSDWYGDYDESVQADPQGPESGSIRVGRGGGWGSLARGCRSANRDGDVPSCRSGILGFRPALVPAAE